MVANTTDLNRYSAASQPLPAPPSAPLTPALASSSPYQQTPAPVSSGGKNKMYHLVS
ncbi:hypothetical protein IG631_05562 [Alternaria alternata]|nr:hypothetical protein IG631_05562 [Alternaria alternata]